MADSVEIIRMMRHAAARLEEEDAQAILPDNYRQYSDARECRDAAVSADLAMTYAAAVLRLVASFLTEAEAVEQDTTATGSSPGAADSASKPPAGGAR